MVSSGCHLSHPLWCIIRPFHLLGFVPRASGQLIGSAEFSSLRDREGSVPCSVITGHHRSIYTLSRTYEEVVLLSPSSFSILLEGLHVIFWCWVRLLPRKFDTLNLLDLLDLLDFGSEHCIFWPSSFADGAYLPVCGLFPGGFTWSPTSS